MKKNKLIIGGILALLAYYFLNNMRKKKEVSELKDGANTPFVDKVVTDWEADRIQDCEQEWNDKIGSLARFSSEEGRTKSKNSYVASCLKQ
jgi:hypothetical protein